MPPNDNGHFDMGVMQEHMRNIDRNTDCLPKLCEDVTRHSEKLDAHTRQLASLSNRWWGLLIVLLAGCIGALLHH